MRQPIYLTTEEENPNSAQVLFLVGGAQIADWSSASLKGFSRIVLMFDGRESEAVDYARAAWRSAKETGYDVTYWKESPSGKWEKQA